MLRKHRRINARRNKKNWTGYWGSGLDSSQVQVLLLDEQTEPTERQRAAVRAGEAIIIRGSALAKADVLVEVMGRQEVAWYWVAEEDDPEVIVDLYLPAEQEVSSGHVTIPAEAVGAANVAVRRRGRIIVGAGHSHHVMGATTSAVDVELFDQLATEGVGFRSLIHESAEGIVERVRCPDDSTDAEGPRASTFSVRFADCPAMGARMTAPAGVRAEDLHVQLHWQHSRLLTLFSTHDAYRSLHLPLMETVRCALSRTRMQERFLPHPLVIVLNPVVLSDEEREKLFAELERRAPRGFYGRQVVWPDEPGARQTSKPYEELDEERPATVSTPQETSAAKETLTADELETEGDGPAGPLDDNAQAVAETHDRPSEAVGEGALTRSEPRDTPAPFEVYRHGDHELVGLVEARVLEEAAWKVPALGRALGWIQEEMRALPAPEADTRSASQARQRDAEDRDGEPNGGGCQTP